jgi:hypothetical protein
MTQDEYERLMLSVGNTAKEKRKPQTLEEVFDKTQVEVDLTVAPRGESEVLPVPHPDMTIRELSELMEKYERTVKHGYYLAKWTDLKATPNMSLDPRTEAKRFMSTEEIEVFDWFEDQGDQNEFNWDKCRKKGETPPGKELRLKQEIMGMRIMYANNDIDAENLYWLRAERPFHFKVVLAYAKVIQAANNIEQGIKKGTAMDWAEYRTCGKLIAEAGSITNKFNEQINRLMKPIQSATGYIQARKLQMAKRCGVDIKTEGEAVRRAREFNKPMPGHVTAPDEVPRGRRTAREDFHTIKDLRSIAITKKVKYAELPKVEDLDLASSARAGKRKAVEEPYEMNEPTYVPESKGETIMTDDVYKGWKKFVEGGERSNDSASAMAKLTVNLKDDELIRTAKWRVGSSGREVIVVSSALSNAGKLCCHLANSVVVREPRMGEVIKEKQRAGHLLSFMRAHGGFLGESDEIKDVLASEGETYQMEV